MLNLLKFELLTNLGPLSEDKFPEPMKLILASLKKFNSGKLKVSMISVGTYLQKDVE